MSKPLPPGMRTVTPHLVCAGAAEAIAFYQKAFGAIDEMRLPGPDGKLMHACIRIGDCQIFLNDEMPDYGAVGPLALKGSPVTIHLHVDDADAWWKRATEAGCTVTMPLADQFWGDRYGSLKDPFGHQWSIAHSVREVSAAELQAAMQKMG